MTMPDQPIVAIRQLQLLHRGQERRHFGFDGLLQKLAGSRPQKSCQQIIDLVGLTKLNNAVIFSHGIVPGAKGRAFRLLLSAS